MNILIPPPAIADRWNGALESRLRRAPLEAFLRARALRFVSAGAAQVTDNVAAATVAILSTGLQGYSAHKRSLAEAQVEDVAQIACVISSELSSLIHEPHSWRIAALVSAAQLLRAHIGLNAAAHVSAAVARAYAANPKRDPAFSEVRKRSARAVETNDEEHYQAACKVIAQRLASWDYAAGCCRPTLPHYDFDGAIFNSSTT